MLYIKYIVFALGIVFVSITLSSCMDKIDKKTELGSAFIGGVFLAIVTSLPELFTSLTALFQLDKPQLVQGNVIGSNIFNVTIIAIMSILFIRKFSSFQYLKNQMIALLLCVIQCLFILFALFFKIKIEFYGMSIHLVSILILLVYLIGITLFNEGEENDSEVIQSSIYGLYIKFIMYAILLVWMSVQLTKISDLVAISLNLNATIAGAIFLGIATSLPEFTSAFTLCKLNNLHAAIASLIGSCMFNFLILSISDFLYRKEVVYSYDYQTFVFIIFTIAALSYAICLLKYANHTITMFLFSIFLLSCYVMSIVLSL